MRSVLKALPKLAETAVVVAVTGPAGAEAVVVAALWRQRLINALVLVAGADEQGVPVVTAFSFVAFARCRDPSPAVREGVWSCGGWRQGGPAALFPRNAKLRLDGCEVRVVTAEVPWAVVVPGDNLSAAEGVTINMLREMVSTLGFSLRLQSAEDGLQWGWAYANGTGTGMLGDVMSGVADMAAGDYLPIAGRHKLLDMSLTTYWTCIACAVPVKAGS